MQASVYLHYKSVKNKTNDTYIDTYLVPVCNKNNFYFIKRKNVIKGKNELIIKTRYIRINVQVIYFCNIH